MLVSSADKGTFPLAGKVIYNLKGHPAKNRLHQGLGNLENGGRMVAKKFETALVFDWSASDGRKRPARGHTISHMLRRGIWGPSGMLVSLWPCLNFNDVTKEDDGNKPLRRFHVR